MKRKLLAMLLAVCMVVSLIPMVAVAAEATFAKIGSQEFNSLADLNTYIEANKAGGTITIDLTRTAALTGQGTALEIPKDAVIILNTNGYTLSSDYGTYTIDISTLPLTKEDCGSRCHAVLSPGQEHGGSRQRCYTTGGTLTITGNGAIDNTSPGSTTIRVAGTLNVGTDKDDESTLTITKDDGNDEKTRSAIKCEAEGKVNIYCGTIGGDVRSIQNFGQLNIYAGTIENFVDAWQRDPGSPFSAPNVTSTLTIEDGKFEKDVRARASKGEEHTTPGNINISGGEFATVTVDELKDGINYTGTKISGGTFTTAPAEDLIKAKLLVTGEDGKVTYYADQQAAEDANVDTEDILPVGNKITHIGFGWTQAQVFDGIEDALGLQTELTYATLPFIDATLWVNFENDYDVNGNTLEITDSEGNVVFEQEWAQSAKGIFPYVFAGNNGANITRDWVYPSGKFTATLYDGADMIGKKVVEITEKPPKLTAEYDKDSDTLTLTYDTPITGDFSFYVKNTKTGTYPIPISVPGAVGHYVALNDQEKLTWGGGITNAEIVGSDTVITIEDLGLNTVTGTVKFEVGMYFNERNNGGPIVDVYGDEDGEKLMDNKTSFTISDGTDSAPTTPTAPNEPVGATQNENGAIIVSPAPAGSEVVARIMPRYGYAIDTVFIRDAEGNPVAFTDNGDGTYTFTMPVGGATVSATYKPDEHECPGEAYTDVDLNAWYHEALDYVLTHAIMTGTGEDTFAPGGTLTRAMMAQILYNMENQPAVTGEEPFEDVDEDDWYYNAVVWAYTTGVTLGTTDTTFSPEASVTRQQVAAMLYRYAEYKNYDLTAEGSLAYFTDGDKVAGYAVQPMEWAIGAGVFRGNGDSTINPTGTAKRSEIAQIMMNFCKSFGK